VSQADVRAIFVDAEIRAGNWILTPGVRFEDIDMVRLDYATDDPSRSQGPSRVRENTTQVVIPGMGALYRVSEEWRLLAGLHKGFNPPAPGSSASEEDSLNFEAGARYDSGSLSFEGIYFLNDYDNLVGTVTESTGGGGEIGDQFDGGEVKVSGLELSGTYNWSLKSVDVPFELRYTWTALATSYPTSPNTSCAQQLVSRPASGASILRRTTSASCAPTPDRAPSSPENPSTPTWSGTWLRPGSLRRSSRPT
jgi:Fe(3+) dicitrate transport protein